MSIHRIAKGLDIPLAGAPAQATIDDAMTVSQVAWVAADFPGLKGAVVVEAGAPVLCGTPLVVDKRDPSLVHRSPAAGTVVAVHRGERRKLLSIVIARDGEGQVPLSVPGTIDADGVRALLLASGLWTALRTRPFSRVPLPSTSASRIRLGSNRSLAVAKGESPRIRIIAPKRPYPKHGQ